MRTAHIFRKISSVGCSLELTRNVLHQDHNARENFNVIIIIIIIMNVMIMMMILILIIIIMMIMIILRARRRRSSRRCFRNHCYLGLSWRHFEKGAVSERNKKKTGSQSVMTHA